MPAASKVNRDLQEERDKVNFNVEEFTNWFYGGAEKVKEKRYIENYFLSDKDLNLELDTSYLSYKDKYEEAIRRTTIIYRKLLKLHEEMGGTQEALMKIMENLRVTNQAVNKEGTPILLHFGMFTFAIAKLTNDEQRAEWLPRCLNCSILGTYAQTELGHGTFIRRLETTATYDPKTREFVLNSPTLTSYKWWPGNLGHTVNYAIVMAQLYSLGENHGIQPFIVQLRDEETHKPMPGITIGDIGNKVGFGTVNNGFLGFKNVRIPLKNMLMKNSKLTEDGKFIKPKNEKLNYGAMVFVRVSIIMDTAMYLAVVSTIACRYAMVRRQIPIEPNEQEQKIIEHVTKQHKIFPAIAKAVVYKCIAGWLTKLHQSITTRVNTDRYHELHALSCCLKAVCTDEGAKTVESLRLACGEHGSLNSSGLTEIYNSITASQTYEGENTVLLLQTSRFLIKIFNQAMQREKLPSGVAYIAEFINRRGKRELFDNSIGGILRAVQAATAGKIQSAWKKIEENKNLMSIEQATNEAGIELVRSSQLYCHAFMLQIAMDEIKLIISSVSPALGEVFKNILQIYMIDIALNLMGDIMQHVNVTSDDIEQLENRLLENFKIFRTAAIGIVDGFDISDLTLNSTIGSYDGNVYEKILVAAKKSPLNQEDVNKSFHLYLKPFMRSNL